MASSPRQFQSQEYGVDTREEDHVYVIPPFHSWKVNCTFQCLKTTIFSGFLVVKDILRLQINLREVIVLPRIKSSEDYPESLLFHYKRNQFSPNLIFSLLHCFYLFIALYVPAYLPLFFLFPSLSAPLLSWLICYFCNIWLLQVILPALTLVYFSILWTLAHLSGSGASQVNMGLSRGNRNKGACVFILPPEATVSTEAAVELERQNGGLLWTLPELPLRCGSWDPGAGECLLKWEQGDKSCPIVWGIPFLKRN